MGYTVLVMPSASRALERLSQTVFARIDARIKALSWNPRPPGVKKLVGKRDRYRIRVGDYRVLYTVDDTDRLVLVTRVGHRRDVYD